jgi:hypothetical protein
MIEFIIQKLSGERKEVANTKAQQDHFPHSITRF